MVVVVVVLAAAECHASQAKGFILSLRLEFIHANGVS